MPSIFTRSRTTSNKNLPKVPPAQVDGTDEFGRVTSRGSTKAARDSRRTRTVPAQQHRPPLPDAPFIDDGIVEDGYMLTAVSPPEEAEAGQQSYGYLCHERHTVLGLEDATRLVEIITDELGSKGLTTPFLFSNAALDLSTSGVRRVINAFVSNSSFRDECRFAGPHELGMVLRWGLARIVRVVNGQEMRGLLSWDSYVAWRNAEKASNYSRTEFTSFLPLVPLPVRSVLLTLLTFLTRLVAHSTSSGLTPIALSPLFGPLLFGLGQLSLPFHHAYAAYLRSAHATEHLLLAFIRLQEAQASASTPIPSRLKSWIKGYPSMLASDEKLDRPRSGMKTIRVSSVRRNVRLYSPDLVKTGASWAKEWSGAGDLKNSREWQRISPASANAPNLPPLPARYSDTFRKRMDLPMNANPDMGYASSSLSASTSNSSTLSSATSTLIDDKEFGMGKEQERFRSLTDLKWGEFEALGFSESDTKKLQFDLNESSRTGRVSKRTTLTWADFSAAGFSRNDPSLSATLQFSAPVANTITEWPSHSAEMQRKLKKTQKSLPAFGWDTSPVMAAEEVVEEAFLDVFCDLIYDGGWMDRSEGTFRDCNWALVEFKSLPTSNTIEHGATDPRTATTCLLFEEFVPYEYRVQLQAQGTTPSLRKRLPRIFSPSKSKWKPAATLNGQPYTIGSVPRSPHPREVEFEGLLRESGAVTKVITLDQASKSTSQLKVETPKKSNILPSPPRLTASFLSHSNASRDGSIENDVAPPPPPPPKKSRFKIGGLPTSPAMHRNMVPSQAETVEFETRLASYSDDELNSGSNDLGDGKKDRSKRMSRDDAWVDILVASQEKRMGNQDAELKPRATRATPQPEASVSDPVHARKEVEQAMAEVNKHHPPTDDEAEPDVEPVGQSAKPKVPKRAVGYFDLHPERRQLYSAPSQVDDNVFYAGTENYPGQDDASQITEEDEGQAENMKPRDSMYSADESIQTATDDQDIEVPAFVDDEQERQSQEAGHSKTESMTLPPSPLQGGSTTPSKTQSLIEMYREKERQGSTSGSASPTTTPKPSRLPVRAISIQERELEDDDGETLPTPTLQPYDPLSFPDRSSPLRYIHGAPLHNVMEEEEE